MMVQVAPSMCHVHESVCSLNFAQRVRSVELGNASMEFRNYFEICINYANFSGANKFHTSQSSPYLLKNSPPHEVSFLELLSIFTPPPHVQTKNFQIFIYLCIFKPFTSLQ